MSAVPILVEALRASSYVQAMVGQGIFALANAEGADLPHLVVLPLSEAEGYTLDGYATDLVDARVAVVCRSRLALEVLQLGDAVIAALKNLKMVGTRRVDIIRDDVDSAEIVDRTLYRRTIGFRVHYATEVA